MKRFKKTIGLASLCLLSTFLCGFTNASYSRAEDDYVPIMKYDYSDFSYTAELKGQSTDGKTLFYEFTIKNTGSNFAFLDNLTLYNQDKYLCNFEYTPTVFNSCIIRPNESVTGYGIANAGDYNINELKFVSEALMNEDQTFVFDPTKCSVTELNENSFRISYDKNDYLDSYCRFVITIEYKGSTYAIESSGYSLNDTYIMRATNEAIDYREIKVIDAKRFVEYVSVRNSYSGCNAPNTTAIILIGVLAVGGIITVVIVVFCSKRKSKGNENTY